MATHFICQSTEPLPHSYPLSSQQRSHGAVSQYEAYNRGEKSHTQFPPPGWDFSQTSEEDSLPLRQPVPQPSWRDSSVIPDPDLLVTPQKSQSAASNVKRFYEKPSFNPDPLLCVTPEKSFNRNAKEDTNDSQVDKGEKGRPRVRFDIKENLNDGSFIDTSVAKNLDSETYKKPVQNKPYQPELYGDDDDNDETDKGGYANGNPAFSHGRTVKYTVGKVNNQPVYIPLKDQEVNSERLVESDKELDTVKPKIKTKTEVQDLKTKQAGLDKRSVKIVREKKKGPEITNDTDDPIAACRGISDNLPKRKVKVLRENQYGPKLKDYTFPFNQDPSDYAGGEEHMFTRPEYNSTLRMKKEAEKLKSSEIDVARALQKKLTVSGSTQAEIDEKVKLIHVLIL